MTKEETKKETEEKTVNISEKKLAGILKRLETLEKGEAPIITTPLVRTALLTLVEGKPIIKFGGFSEEKNDRNEKELWIEVETNDGEKRKMKYLDLIVKMEKIKVDILSLEVRENVQDYGYTNAKRVDGYKTVDTGVKVPLRVVTPEYFATVGLPDGEKLTVNNKVLNI